MKSLELKKISYSYGKKEILKDIDYKFFEGELVGILGANGSGKSTLLKIIMGFLNRVSGDILLNKKSTDEYSRREFARKVAFITQSSNQDVNFTVLETLKLGRVPHIKNFFKGLDLKDESLVQEIVDLLKLEDFLERDIKTLSGGEFQRVLLGRAFIQEGEVLLLDEPTSALDINYSLEFLELLKDRVIQKKLIGIIVIHDINLASIFCDKIIFIKDGEISFEGRPKGVIKSKILEEVYNFKPVILEADNEIYVLPKRRIR